jgi:2-oxoglutarate ferredoxin oxidoreductase subunit alpha
VREFIRRHRVNYVIEMNRDGQLKQLLLLDNPDISNRIVSLAYFDGLPMTARYVREAILAAEEERDE